MSNLDIFRMRFKGNLFVPGDPGHARAVDRWATNAVKPTAIVAVVRDTRDIILALGFASANSLRVSVRGGGYAEPDTPPSVVGLIIDLSRHFINVRVDPDTMTCHIQGGATWRGIDIVTTPYGLACVGPTVNQIGVGGFTLAGGYGWLTGAHGLGIENLVQAEIVTADGSFLKVSEAENSDLFWAMRKGHPNLGVVTSFALKLHHQRRKVYAGRVVFAADDCEKISGFLDEWWPNARPEEGIMVCLMTAPGVQTAITCIVFYNGSERDGRNAYKKLFDIGPISDWSGEVPYEELNGILNSFAPWGAYYCGKSVPFRRKPSQLLNSDIYHRFMILSTSMDHTVTMIQEYIAHGRIGGPSMAPNANRSKHGRILVRAKWMHDTVENNETAQEIVRAIISLFPSTPSGAIMVPSSAEELAMLEATRKKFDPDGVFGS